MPGKDFKKSAHEETEAENARTKNFEDLFKALLEDTLKDQKSLEGKIVKGRIVAIDHDAIVVNVSSKSEGRIPLKEFGDAERSTLKVGAQVDVYIERYEGRDGGMILSHQKAIQEVTWMKLAQAFEEKKPISGKILGMVKGGLSVDLGGTVAFLPGSQVDIRPSRDSGELIGTDQMFLIVKIDEARGNIVVSRRAVLEEERASDKARLLSELKQGMIVKGVVKNLAPYGAFIDLGGIDGLLHISDLSYNKRVSIEDVLRVGQMVEVMVIRFNRENERISLGLRQLEKDPWQTIHEIHKVGSIVPATITNITEYGAFAELSEGIEGLIHAREMTWHKKDVIPSEVVAQKDEVQVMILEIDSAKRRISLGLKQCTENLFEIFSKNYPVGSQVETEIKGITEFGLLVTLPHGIEFAVHKSELSWTLPPDEALSRYHIGQRIQLKVTKVSCEEEFIGLSVKQVSNNASMARLQAIEKGQNIKARIIRIADSGLEVDLGGDVLSFIHRSELGEDSTHQNPHFYKVGDVIEAKVTKINVQTQQVLLSVKALDLEERSRILSEYTGNVEKENSFSSALERALEFKE
ncbi:30S ribosomal protein S1 [Holospora curviuscula]|uniref:Small ribosomal subunit protein bS1 n=1 Tax=Holospora curviuscula TaxID=1082868 RepID=A0A2S5R748_9PROT|nr:30S ribosomal protein S1 [Holospora curviuscula]PPE03113.1 30S ribosomal protein S1 [Holospora curviuscula]